MTLQAWKTAVMQCMASQAWAHERTGGAAMVGHRRLRRAHTRGKELAMGGVGRCMAKTGLPGHGANRNGGDAVGQSSSSSTNRGSMEHGGSDGSGHGGTEVRGEVLWKGQHCGTRAHRRESK